MTDLARWVSRIFHPYALCGPALFLSIYLDTGEVGLAIQWSIVAVAVFLIPLVVFVRWMVKSGRYSDDNVSIQQQRKSAYAVAGALAFLLFAIFVLGNAPRIGQACLASVAAVAIIGVLINRITKISIHAMISAGCAAVITILSPPIGSVLVAGTIATGWSRVYLRQHSIGQVLLGWFVAVGSVVIIFVFGLQYL
jgi:membrane-associated phospholipid phosphatase